MERTGRCALRNTRINGRRFSLAVRFIFSEGGVRSGEIEGYRSSILGGSVSRESVTRLRPTHASALASD